MSDPTSLPNFPPPADEHPLRGRVLDALQDLGLDPDIDGDGDVKVVVNDQQLFVRCSEGDLQIMRVFGQWQLPAEIDGQPAVAFETCNELNLTLNCVKTGIANNTLVVTSEHIAGPQSDVSMLVQVGIQVVLSAVHHWHQRALGLEPDLDGDGGQGGQAGQGGEAGFEGPEGTDGQRGQA